MRRQGELLRPKAMLDAIDEQMIVRRGGSRASSRDEGDVPQTYRHVQLPRGDSPLSTIALETFAASFRRVKVRAPAFSYRQK
jgi:hypothetical protein